MSRTHRFFIAAGLATVIAAVAAVAGCQSGDSPGESVAPRAEEPKPVGAVLALSVGTVRLLEARVHDDRFLVDVASDALGARTVELQAWSTSNAKGMSVAVHDPDGALTWQMSFEGDGPVFRMVETTETTSLVATRTSLGAGRWREVYDLDEYGVPSQIQLDYREQDAEEMRRAAASFDDFWPGDTDLDDNADGRLAAALITSQGFYDFVSARLGDHGLEGDPPVVRAEKAPEPVEGLCILANTCALMKCWLGGPSNAVCDVCTSIAVACALFEAFCYFIGC